MDVTIEGTVTPCVLLKRGERRRVTLTDRVQGLIDRGFVRIVERHGETRIERQERVAIELADADADDDPAAVDHAPAGNASRDVWAAWLHAQNIPFPDGEIGEDGEPVPVATRDDLRIIWQQASGGS